MQKILIMVFALALNSGLSLQASGEPRVKREFIPVSQADALKFFNIKIAKCEKLITDMPSAALMAKLVIESLETRKTFLKFNYAQACRNKLLPSHDEVDSCFFEEDAKNK